MKRQRQEESKTVGVLRSGKTRKQPLNFCREDQEQHTEVSWSLEEDNFLIEEAEKNNSLCNWKTLCKLFNKRYKQKRRTIEECKQRYYLLIENTTNCTWSQNEDFLLLYSIYNYGKNWEIIASVFPNRRSFDVKRRFFSIFTFIVKHIKSPNFAILSPLDIFKALFFIMLILDKSNNPEIGDMQKLFGLKDEDCINLLNTLVKIMGAKSIKWSRATLTKIMDNIIEKLKNTFLSYEAYSQNFEDIMHGPAAISGPPNNYMVPYVMIPAYSYGFPVYCLALCCIVMPTNT